MKMTADELDRLIAYLSFHKDELWTVSLLMEAKREKREKQGIRDFPVARARRKRSRYTGSRADVIQLSSRRKSL